MPEWVGGWCGSYIFRQHLPDPVSASEMTCIVSCLALNSTHSLAPDPSSSNFQNSSYVVCHQHVELPDHRITVLVATDLLYELLYVASGSGWHPGHTVGELGERRQAEASDTRFGRSAFPHTSCAARRWCLNDICWRRPRAETEVTLSAADGRWSSWCDCCSWLVRSFTLLPHVCTHSTRYMELFHTTSHVSQ